MLSDEGMLGMRRMAECGQGRDSRGHGAVGQASRRVSTRHAGVRAPREILGARRWAMPAPVIDPRLLTGWASTERRQAPPLPPSRRELAHQRGMIELDSLF